MELEPVISSDKPTVLVHNVFINCGYVESARHATVMCTHRLGFSDPQEALLHLHKTLKAGFVEACQEYNYYNPCGEDGEEQLAEWINEWCGSDNDGSPGGYDPWEVMQAYDWDIPGHLTTGMVIEIVENGGELLSSERLIKNHIKAFRGEYVPYRDGEDWPLTSDLRMYVVTVGEIKPKPINRPEKKK